MRYQRQEIKRQEARKKLVWVKKKPRLVGKSGKNYGFVF